MKPIDLALLAVGGYALYLLATKNKFFQGTADKGPITFAPPTLINPIDGLNVQMPTVSISKQQPATIDFSYYYGADGMIR
jgi:hypothetical protein